MSASSCTIHEACLVSPWAGSSPKPPLEALSLALQGW
jgi:hypothetical protein